MDRELTPKQQTSEAVRQAETILIMTGQHPTVDQVASTIALSEILRKFGKKVTAVISDGVPAGARFLATEQIDRQLGGLRDFIVQIDLSKAEVDTLRYTIEQGKLNVHVTPFKGGFAPADVTFDYGDYHYDLVIVLGVASYGRIDRIYGQNAELLQRIPLVNIDFHRSNEQYGAINLIDGNAASLGEPIVALSESLQPGLIDTSIATTILTGIMSATDRFTATHTTAKALTVAAQMMAAGADQRQVVSGLYRPGAASSKDKDKEKPVKPQTASQPAAAALKPHQPQPQSVPVAEPVVVTEPITPTPVAPAPAPEVQITSAPIPQAPVTSTPPSAQPVLEAPLAAMPELDFELPPVAAPSPAQAATTPEPLINGSDVPPATPTSQPVSQPAENPTNKPIFANRLP